MLTILLAFANSDNPAKHLPTLTHEYDGLINALQDRERNADFRVISRPLATRTQLLADIRAWEQDICLFLFSGHAGRDRLLLEDGSGDADGIAAMLSRCPNLKVVILNGCSTAKQVDQLHQSGIPIIIATSSPIGDETATQFSIALFNNLSKHKLPIREAFFRAVDVARVYGQQQRVDLSRGLDTGQDLAKDEPLWGLYYQEKDESLLDSWHLPTKDLPVGEGKGKVNEKIRIALTKIAKRYEITSTPNATLERLPFVISEPIRCLTAPESKNQKKNQFYDTPSWERFQMILYAYRAIVNLTTFGLLAEAWGRSLRGSNPQQLPDDCLIAIKKALFTPANSDTQVSNLSVLKLVGKALVTDCDSIFLTEMKAVLDALNRDEIGKVLDDLESKITNQNHLKSYFGSASETLKLCLEAENSFSVVLLVFGFWVKYSLTSIKNIELLKFRHLKNPSYLHQFVPLQIHAIARAQDERHTIAIALESCSIILHPYGHWQEGGLNLSPFLVDQNALLRLATSDVYYLVSFSVKQSGLFCYRKVSSYDAVWAIAPKKQLANDIYNLVEDEQESIFSDYYTLLKEQIAAFTQSVLHTSLDEL